MKLTSSIAAAAVLAFAAGQTLNIPTRVGNIQWALESVISSNRDFRNAEFDSGVACNTGESGRPVFIVEDGVTISNLIIGMNQEDGKDLVMLHLDSLSLIILRYSLSRLLYVVERLVPQRL